MSERKPQTLNQPQKRKPPSDTGNPCEAHVYRVADGAKALVIAWIKNDKNSPAKKAYMTEKAVRVAAKEAARFAAENAAKEAARFAAEEAAKEAAQKAARAAAGKAAKKAAQKAARAAEKAELTELENVARTTAANATRCQQQRIRAKELSDAANAAANAAATAAAATTAVAATAVNTVLADFKKLCAGQEAYELQKALVAASKSASAVYYAAINAAVNSAAAASAAALAAADAFTAVGAHSAALSYFNASKKWLNI